MLKKFKKFVLLLAFTALYFNIGWGLGYYYHYNVFVKKFESASWHAKLFAGHRIMFGRNQTDIKAAEDSGPWAEEIGFSFLWPLFLAFSLVFWAFHFVWWTAQFIFWGGLVRLIFGIP